MQNIDWTALAKAYFESNGLALHIKSRHVTADLIEKEDGSFDMVDEQDVFTVSIRHGAKHDAINLRRVEANGNNHLIGPSDETSIGSSDEACRRLLRSLARSSDRIRVDYFDGPGGCTMNGGHSIYRCGMTSADECKNCVAGMKFVESTWLEQFDSEEEMLLKLSVRAR